MTTSAVMKILKDEIGANNQEEISERTGFKLSRVKDLGANRVHKFTKEEIAKIVELSTLERAWILSDDDEIGISKYLTVKNTNKMIESKKLSVSKSQIDESSLVKVPIMSASASGSKITIGIEHFDVSVDGELLIDRMLFKILPNLQNIQAVRVIGESMYPTLREDDYVVIECEERFTGDGLYVLSWDGILLVKRLQAGNSVVRVLSDNQTFESMEYNPTEDQRTFHIVGKVILKIQR